MVLTLKDKDNENSQSFEKEKAKLFQGAEKAIEFEMFDQCHGTINKLKEIGLNSQEKLMVEDLKRRIIKGKNSKKSFHILINGDSLSLPRPYRNRTFNPTLDPTFATQQQDCYPAILQREVSKLGKYENIYVTNLGAASSTVLEVKKRMINAFHYQNPDLVVKHFGIVDCVYRRDKDNNYYQKVTIERFRDTVKEILRYKEETCPTKRMYIICIMPVNKRTEDKFPGVNDMINEYNDALSSNIDRYTKFIDLRPYIEKDVIQSKYVHLDGYHLSTEGHALIAQVVMENILEDFPRFKIQQV